jgi:hypothetical protein
MSISGSASLIQTDRQEYENTCNCILTQNMDKSEEYTIDKKLDYLTRVISFGVASSSKYSTKSSRCSSGVHAVFSPFLMHSGIFDLT